MKKLSNSFGFPNLTQLILVGDEIIFQIIHLNVTISLNFTIVWIYLHIKSYFITKKSLKNKLNSHRSECIFCCTVGKYIDWYMRNCWQSEKIGSIQMIRNIILHMIIFTKSNSFAVIICLFVYNSCRTQFITSYNNINFKQK